MNQCKTCKRKIIWAINESGSALILDARPVQGHVYKLHDGEAGPVAESLAGNYRPQLYVSHFLTCPQASQHSKGAK